MLDESFAFIDSRRLCIFDKSQKYFTIYILPYSILLWDFQEFECAKAFGIIVLTTNANWMKKKKEFFAICNSIASANNIEVIFWKDRYFL